MSVLSNFTLSINYMQIKMPKISNLQSFIQAKKFGEKRICVITGTSSGLGRKTAKALLKTGKWHVVGACRDVDKMLTVAEEGAAN